MERDEIQRWYIAWCKPRQEVVAEENLLRQGFRVYLPRILSRLRKRGKWRDSIEMLFPRYVFIQIDPRRKGTESVRSTRGVVSLVRFGAEPAVVPDWVMDELLRREDSVLRLHRDTTPLFAAGDRIRLVDGPLEGVEGVFHERDGEKRVVVLLNLLGQANRIRVNRDWVAQAA